MTTLLIYVLSTPEGAVPFWENPSRMDGWVHLTFAGLLLAPWTALASIVRQKEAFARDQKLTFALERSELERVDMVRHEVAAIWAAQAVRIEWSCAETTGCVRLVIDRPASVLPAIGRQEQWSVAATRVVSGQVSGPIYVSLDAAERVVRAASPPYSTPALAGRMVTRVVGRAIAHELAHFLLNTRAHSRRGLLRARYRADDFVSPGLDGFKLDDQQLARARRHELLVTPLQ